MTAADILYFGTLAATALVSTVVLLRQLIRGDLAGRDATIRRHCAPVALRPRRRRLVTTPPQQDPQARRRALAS